MTEQTRRTLFRYGIAVDLVILATGAAMLAAAPAGSLLIFLYAAAVSLSVWRGGWKGGLVALLLSIVALVAAFPGALNATQMAILVLASLVGGGIVGWITRAPAGESVPSTQGDAVLPGSGLVAVAAVPLQAEENAPIAPVTLAPVVPFSEAPSATKPSGKLRGREAKARAAAERRAAEERVARERASAKEEKKRAESERHAGEKSAARGGGEGSERGAVEQAAARERAENERRAIEAEAERQHAETEPERKRIEDERRLAEEHAARERAENERRAVEAERERKRVEDERRVADEQAARERAENERRAVEAERERKRIEEERRLADEQAAREQAESERRAVEAERERKRIEEERRLAEEHAARERAENERRAVEAEAERKRIEDDAERKRIEDERRRAEEHAARERAENERRTLEAEAEQKRVEAERKRIEAEQKRIEAERRAAEESAARERAENERRLAEAERLRLERELRERIAIEERVEAARRAAEEESARHQHEAEAERRRLDDERARMSEELEARVAQERAASQRELHDRLEAERRVAEEQLRKQLEQERETLRATLERELAAERARSRKDETAPPPKPIAKPVPAEKPSLVDTLTGWLRGGDRSRAVNLKNKRLPANAPVKRPPNGTARPASPEAPVKLAAKPAAKPRLLFIERRRATADTIAPRLRNRGIEVEIVERWVDAVDEIFRFKPHALFLDIEHPEFERMHQTIAEKTSRLPIVLTGRAGHTPPSIQRAAFLGRPYDTEEVLRLAQQASMRPEDLLAEQAIPRSAPVPPPLPVPVSRPIPAPIPAPSLPTADAAPSGKPITDQEYEILCYSCRSEFNAIDADWCSCLAKERTLVCTNCLTCFCKAPPSYKEKFWVHAPQRLFERKSSEVRGQGLSLPPNPHRAEVLRPLVLAVEDDEEIQAIVQRVCANLDYGFIWATNGQDGLDLAREYRPNMILSDAFMPKLDGREMCRMLKEEPAFADTPMVVMTGLYTDTKYRSEAVRRFHVDDYIAKPVAITDLINLLQKHLEGVTGLPMPEDLHALHRQDVEETRAADIALADLLAATPSVVPIARSRGDAYDVSCFNCQGLFDATRAEWCNCVGRDHTLVCPTCDGCFCKAPAAYRERFWIDAPSSLFERKMIGSKRHLGTRSNPTPAEVKRPLVLLVEDDENVQLIVRTVVSNMGFGFVVGADGQEGLTLAREYSPDMILSDAFMPKLDGREMCRLLKDDPGTARAKAVIMTGLYTDRKYRNEALDYFKVDDYVAKPLAVDDLIQLFKKHLPQELTAAN